MHSQAAQAKKTEADFRARSARCKRWSQKKVPTKRRNLGQVDDRMLKQTDLATLCTPEDELLNHCEGMMKVNVSSEEIAPHIKKCLLPHS